MNSLLLVPPSFVAAFVYGDQRRPDPAFQRTRRYAAAYSAASAAARRST